MFATTKALAFQRSAELARSFKNTVFEDGGVPKHQQNKNLPESNYKSQFNSENEFLTASLLYGKIIVNLVRPSFPV